MILIINMEWSIMGEVYSQCKIRMSTNSLISVDRLDLQVVIVYVGVYIKLFVLVHKVCDV